MKYLRNRYKNDTVYYHFERTDPNINYHKSDRRIQFYRSRNELKTNYKLIPLNYCHGYVKKKTETAHSLLSVVKAIKFQNKC